jgi:hypothetical protein
MRSDPDKAANPGWYRQEIADSNTYDGEAAAGVSSDIDCHDGVADKVVLLDDVMPRSGHDKKALSDSDLRLVEALQAVLEAGQTDISIKSIRAQIGQELDWD